MISRAFSCAYALLLSLLGIIILQDPDYCSKDLMDPFVRTESFLYMWEPVYMIGSKLLWPKILQIYFWDLPKLFANYEMCWIYRYLPILMSLPWLSK